MSSVTISERKPLVEEYIKLRNSIGWKVLQHGKIEEGLNNSTYCVCVEDQGDIIGFGRIVGDGATVFYIQDIIVLPSYQKQKIGTLIMKKIMDYIDENCVEGAIIGLIAISELDRFYKKFGFTYNQNNRFYRC
ncbi:GNAT family N-acetyltransferase [Clostridium sp. HMP27]|uniref:GNAT family N-acetyltransferase n=1 Tax=Clostridium sp. HMP27 TaxID=1487921 RepID=UPI00052CBE2A|nr:GNAT family N-acetyltransferase [Clostridium sp. HMP27]KGK90294.1 GCN5 family acetyltransferase [Clostridium sp. HMP27]